LEILSISGQHLLYRGFDFGGTDSCEGGMEHFKQEIEYWE